MRRATWTLALRLALAPTLALALVACAESHTPLTDGAVPDAGDAPADAGRDAGPSADGGDAADDAGPVSPSDAGPAPVRCGPNTCVYGEVCCAAVCGLCAPEGSCPTEGVCVDP